MARTDRLLTLMQALRKRRAPVTAAQLAAELGVSERTVYRDVATLRGQGAAIDGEAGVGFVLQPGFMLPPLMFTADELEALTLGMRWVAARGGTGLSAAADDALAKISAVLPAQLRREVDEATFLIGPVDQVHVPEHLLHTWRLAMRAGQKVRLTYRALDDVVSERVVWPVSLSFFERVRIAVAWCELRGAFRHFRADRVLHIEPLEARIPRARRVLLDEWRADMGMDVCEA